MPLFCTVAHGRTMPPSGRVSLLACLLAAACTLVHGSMDAAGLDRYDELLMQGLYKRLSQIDSSYFLDDNAGGGGDFRASRDDGEAGMGAAIRDSEYIQHSSNAGSDGFIHMSGSTR